MTLRIFFHDDFYAKKKGGRGEKIIRKWRNDKEKKRINRDKESYLCKSLYLTLLYRIIITLSKALLIF